MPDSNLRSSSVTALMFLATLVGCASTPMGPLVQVMPGPNKAFDVFQTDILRCKSFAQSQVEGQAAAANYRGIGSGVLTTAAGGSSGALVGMTLGNTGYGMAAGTAGAVMSAVPAGIDTSKNAETGIQTQYDNAYTQCMYSRGNLVNGYSPQDSTPPSGANPQGQIPR